MANLFRCPNCGRYIDKVNSDPDSWCASCIDDYNSWKDKVEVEKPDLKQLFDEFAQTDQDLINLKKTGN